jgi:cobalt-zinc-cadmium resistance protein CzcA
MKIAAVLAKVPGITDLAVLRSWASRPYDRRRSRTRAARYGLRPAMSTPWCRRPSAAKRRRSVRRRQRPAFPDDGALERRIAQNLDAIRRIPCGDKSPTGSGVIQVPLEDVADVRLVSGAAFIYREQQQRYVPIKFSVRGRDLGSAVLEAQHAVDSQCNSAGRVSLWSGWANSATCRRPSARLECRGAAVHRLIVLLAVLEFRACATRCWRPA